MKREHLEHVLRAASRIAGDPLILVVGSQSVLGAIPEERLPATVTASVEVDVAFLDDSDDHKADLVDGAIGEPSQFHETFGCYALGVSIAPATLPAGWRDRLVVVDTPQTSPGQRRALDPHDCVLSKLVAGRDKDHALAAGSSTTSSAGHKTAGPERFPDRPAVTYPSRSAHKPTLDPTPAAGLGGSGASPVSRPRTTCTLIEHDRAPQRSA